MGPIRSSNGKLAGRQAGKANPMETCNYMCILKTVATVDDEVIATAMTCVRRALRRRPNSFVGSLFSPATVTSPFGETKQTLALINTLDLLPQ